MTALGLIIACGLLAIVYGIWAIWSVLQADPGSARMQEIAAAVREGAQAYLKRQYTTIAIAGIVIFVIVGYLLGWLVAIGFAIYFAFLTFGGVLQGLAMLDPARPFMDSVELLTPYLMARTFGGTLMAAGHLVFAYHFFAIALKIMSCTFIVRSSAAAPIDPQIVNFQDRRRFA